MMKYVGKYVKIAALLSLPTTIMGADGFDVEKDELTSRPFVEVSMETYKGQVYLGGVNKEILAEIMKAQDGVVTSRPFVEADRDWASELGVKAYMEMYKGQPYYWGPNYEFLAPTDDAGKEKTLWADAKTLVDTYLADDRSLFHFHPVVLTYKEKDIGGVFYRVAPDNLLILDEFVLVESVSSDLKKYILDEYLRKLEPTCQIFTFALRPINADYMTLFNDLGYRPQFPDVVKALGRDPVLYMGLVKTFE